MASIAVSAALAAQEEAEEEAPQSAAQQKRGRAATQSMLTLDIEGTIARAAARPKMPRGIVDPHGKLRGRWDLLIAALLIYMLFMIPFRVGFEQDSVELSAWWVWDNCCDVLFLVDIALNFSTAVLDEDGELVTARGAIVGEYVRGWFPIDLVASVPVDLLMYTTSAADAVGNPALLRMPRMLRFFKLLRLLRLLKAFKLSSVLGDLEDDIPASPTLVKIVKISILMFVLCHITACAFHFLAAAEGHAGINWTYADRYTARWEAKQGRQINSTGMTYDPKYADRDGEVYSAWVAGMYWCMQTYTTVGFGDVLPGTILERIFGSLGMFAGVSCFALIVANLTQLVDQAVAKSAKVASQLNRFAIFSRASDLPAALKKKAKEHLRYHHETREETQEFDILQELSVPLQQEVALHLNYEAFKYVKLFRGADSSLISALCHHLVPRRVHREELIVHAGDRADAVYILAYGECKCSWGGSAESVMRKGSTICEVSLVRARSSLRCTVTAVTECLFYVLKRSSLTRALENYADVAAQLKELKFSQIWADNISLTDNSTWLSVINKHRSAWDRARGGIKHASSAAMSHVVAAALEVVREEELAAADPTSATAAVEKVEARKSAYENAQQLEKSLGDGPTGDLVKAADIIGYAELLLASEALRAEFPPGAAGTS